MNERIKELMIVALQEQYGDAATPGAREAALELVSGWGTKFAELIVKECASLSMEAIKRAEVHGIRDVADYVDLKIKEHFGVAE